MVPILSRKGELESSVGNMIPTLVERKTNPYCASETAFPRTQSPTHSLRALDTWRTLSLAPFSKLFLRHPKLPSSCCLLVKHRLKWRILVAGSGPWIPSEADTFLGMLPYLALDTPAPMVVPSRLSWDAATRDGTDPLQEDSCCFPSWRGCLFLIWSPSSSWAPLLRTMRISHSETGQREVKLGRGSDSTEWMVLDHPRSKHSPGTGKTGRHSL